MSRDYLMQVACHDTLRHPRRRLAADLRAAVRTVAGASSQAPSELARGSRRYMPRKLKTYQTSQGFYDLAIAAPSMKAALAAWGTSRNLFHQGFAKESDDSEVIAAAMAKPGVVLQRPVGSDKPFLEHAELPTAASLDAYSRGSKAPPKRARAPKARKLDDKAE